MARPGLDHDRAKKPTISPTRERVGEFTQTFHEYLFQFSSQRFCVRAPFWCRYKSKANWIEQSVEKQWINQSTIAVKHQTMTAPKPIPSRIFKTSSRWYVFLCSIWTTCPSSGFCTTSTATNVAEWSVAQSWSPWRRQTSKRARWFLSSSLLLFMTDKRDNEYKKTPDENFREKSSPTNTEGQENSNKLVWFRKWNIAETKATIVCECPNSWICYNTVNRSSEKMNDVRCAVYSSAHSTLTHSLTTSLSLDRLIDWLNSFFTPPSLPLVRYPSETIQGPIIDILYFQGQCSRDCGMKRRGELYPKQKYKRFLVKTNRDTKHSHPERWTLKRTFSERERPDLLPSSQF